MHIHMYTYIYYTRVESVCVCVLVRATRTFLRVWLAAYHPRCALACAYVRVFVCVHVHAMASTL